MLEKLSMAVGLRQGRLWRGLGVGSAVLAALALLLVLSSSLTAQGQAAAVQLLAPTIIKSSVTSIVETNNAINQAVAGELVTVTVEFNVPSGETIYDASPRVLLADGLLPTGSNPSWSAMYTDTRTNLREYEPLAARNGALVIFPTEGTTVTGPATLTRVVYAVRTQRQYVGTTEIGHGSNLRVQAVLRYCADAQGCGAATVAVSEGTSTAQINAIRPEIAGTCSEIYLDSVGVGAGGGQVRLSFASNPTNRPAAHNVVFTATLGAGLTYNDSNDGASSSGPSSSTYVTWNKASLPAGDTWQPVVTATLPNPLVIGHEFTCQGMATYETFVGDVPNEGKYSTGAQRVLRPGLSAVAKTSIPASGAVTMGDQVAYTVVIQQGANTLLQQAQMVDTQPLGFHYISGTFALQNAPYTLITEPGGTGNVYQNLKWVMGDLTATQPRVMTATYTVLNTGLNYVGDPVHATAANMKASIASIRTNVTGAVLSWTPPGGSTYSAAARANAGALGVIQPFMGDNFSTLRTDAGNREIGQSINLTIKFHNRGALASGQFIPAYELEMCDTLPTGLEFNQDNGCFVSGTSTSCSFSYTPPSIGDEGVICWQVPALERTTTFYEFRYQAIIKDAAFPGAHTNGAYVTTYSSQAGAVAGERIYSEFPVGLPSANCGASCFTILGLEGNKKPWVTHVAPGDLLTYTLLFTDTSATDYTGLVVTDTYDALLTFVSAVPVPTSHNSGARTLFWDLGSVPTGGNRQVVLTMRVASVIAAHYSLTNTMAWDSTQTIPHTLSTVTQIDVADLHVSMSGSESTYAGGPVVYTVVYSNTGSWNNAPVTLTLDYGPYLTYVSSSLTPVSGNNVFVITVPNDGVNKTLTINLTAKAPLPYTLEEIYSSVVLASAGAPSQNDDWTVVLRHPVFEFRKTGPPAAAALNGTMQYTFQLRNTGDYTATNLVITDTWDIGTIFQVSPGWTEDGSGLFAKYTIASLAPGATATVYPLTVKVVTQQDSYLNVAELSSTQTTIQETELLIWSHSIALSKSAYPDPAFPGRVLTYTLYYTNTGGGIVSAVIADTLPAGFSFQGQSFAAAPGCTTGWGFISNPPHATWTCAGMSSSATGYFQIWGLVTAEENTSLVNTAESYGESISTRPMAPLYTLVARPWLRVDKVGAPTHLVAPDDYVTYTLTYENYGSYAAYDVVIKDHLPTQLAFAGCDLACTHSGGLVTWNIGLVPTATIDTVMVYATVKAGTHGQTATNSNYTIENTTVWQKLTPAETITGPAVNTTILDPELTLAKSASPSVAQNVNDTIVYTVTYQNTGGGALHGIVLTDALDSHTGFVSASANCIHSGGASGGDVVCTLGDLVNGESRQIIIRVSVLTGLNSGDTILNQAAGRTDETALTTSNITTVWFQAAGAPQIAVAPTSLSSLVKVGANAFDIPLVISNTGQVPLTWAVAETPPGVTWLSQSPTGGPLTSGVHATVMVTFNPGGLVAGDYTTTLVFTSGAGGNTVNVPVQLTVASYRVYLPIILRGQ